MAIPLIIPNGVTFDESDSSLLIAAKQSVKKNRVSQQRYLLRQTVRRGRIYWKQYLKSGKSKIRWEEYPLELEYRAASLKGHKIKSSLAALKKRFKAIIEKAKSAALSEKDPKKRMVAILKTLLSTPLRLYKRGQALLPLLLEGKRGNCEAEMKFLLGVFTSLINDRVDLGLKGYLLGIQCFKGHIRIVFFNKEQNLVFDPLMNVHEEGLQEDLFDPHLLLFAELKGIGQKHLKAPPSLIFAKKNVPHAEITEPDPVIPRKSNTFLDFTFAEPSSRYTNAPSPDEAELIFNEGSGKITYKKALKCDKKITLIKLIPPGPSSRCFSQRLQRRNWTCVRQPNGSYKCTSIRCVEEKK